MIGAHTRAGWGVVATGTTLATLGVILTLATPAAHAANAACPSAASSTANSCSYASTGAEQSFSVPAGVGTIQITAVGAPGAGDVTCSGCHAGSGASVAATVPLPAGTTTLRVEVGSKGVVGAPSFNGGAVGGGTGCTAFNPCGSSGGGASDVRTDEQRLVVAGGGGGAGVSGGSGGNAGDLTVTGPGAGGNGSLPTSQTGGNGGLGGTSGGAGGASGPDFPGAAGVIDQGGAGGGDSGGGGGGGYYGGGGGGSGYGGSAGGGGAGSSFWASTATNTSLSTDTTGTPEVVISWIAAVLSTTTSVVSSPNPSLVGQPVTYTATVTPAPNAGTISFNDVAGCAAAPVDSTTGQAICQTTYAMPGTQTITAVYSGDDSSATSSSPALTQTVSYGIKSRTKRRAQNPGSTVQIAFELQAYSGGALANVSSPATPVTALCVVPAGTTRCGGNAVLQLGRVRRYERGHGDHPDEYTLAVKTPKQLASGTYVVLLRAGGEAMSTVHADVSFSIGSHRGCWRNDAARRQDRSARRR